MVFLPHRNFCSRILASLVLYGGFSRLTHGQYTPSFYAWQEYHHPDDGSTASQIIPYVDMVLGSLLYFRQTRLLASIFITTFFVFGLGVQYTAGKDFGWDILISILGSGAVIETLTAGSTEPERPAPATKLDKKVAGPSATNTSQASRVRSIR